MITICGCQSNNKISSTEISSKPEFSSEKGPTEFGNESAPSTENIINDETDEFDNEITYRFDKSNFPLYAMIKSEDIYLYGIEPYGMVLYQNGKGTYFDWPGLTPRCILPALSYFDYDGDGKKEVAVTLYWGSGSGVSIMDLHILKIKEPEYDWDKLIYTDHSLLGGNIEKWFTKKFTAKYSKDKKTIAVHFNGKKYNVENPDVDSEFGTLNGVGYASVVEFDSNEKKEIITTIAIGFFYEKVADAVYFGEVEAKVNFDGKKIHLSDYKFTMDESTE